MVSTNGKAPAQGVTAHNVPRNHQSVGRYNEPIDESWDNDDPDEEPLLDINRSSSHGGQSSDSYPTGSFGFTSLFANLIRKARDFSNYPPHRRKQSLQKKPWWKDPKTMAKLVGTSLSVAIFAFFLLSCGNFGLCAFRKCAPYQREKLARFPNSIDQYLASHKGEDAAKRIKKKLGRRPMAVWIGDWEANPRNKAREVRDFANREEAMYTVVAYSIPNRDCGQHSQGGAESMKVYNEWAHQLASGLSGSKRGGIVILEPDALTLNDCLSEEDKKDRYEMLTLAVLKLKAAGAHVYIDAGHANWLAPEEVASRLKKAGVRFADGFALNTANGVKTDKSIKYGNEVVRQLRMRRGFVIDVSRNGAGAASGEGEDSWCNPPSLRIGKDPTLATRKYGCNVHGLLWIKTVGESDGTCRGGPAAGEFWEKGALTLLGEE